MFFHAIIIPVLNSVKPDGKFKVPNGEVMLDWARWIVGGACFSEDILNECANGPVSAFTTKWPDFLQDSLDPKSVAKVSRAASKKTPERIYQVHLLGLFHTLQLKGWDIAIEPKAGTGYIDVCLISKKKQIAVIIEIKSSETEGQIEKDADKALQQIIDKNYRNREGLSGIRILREYGIASYRLMSFAKGRYLELNEGKWVEKDDPAKAQAWL